MTHNLHNEKPSIKGLKAVIKSIPRLPIAQLPTPVSRFNLSGLKAGTKLFIKDDGLCNSSYGGNKVRKLEFLLAQARALNVQHVITLGAAGSNHAVATAVHAHALKMRCSVAMTHQPISAIAQKNLRRHLHIGTDLSVFERYRDAVEHAERLARQEHAYLVPLGGSAPLATMGYVQAVVELMEQVARKECPLPDRVYVACGTMGTAVGLALGFALVGAPTKVVAVRVTDSAVASMKLFEQLYRQSADLLHQHEQRALKDNPHGHHSALNMPWHTEQILFDDEFYGEGYAVPTPAALDAIETASRHNIELEGTYTGKALSALLAHAQRGELDGKNVLFWRTLNSARTPMASWGEQQKLDVGFRPYFVEKLS